MEALEKFGYYLKEFMKGLGTILIYLLISLICSYFFRDYYYHDNRIIASIFQVLVYVIMLIVLGLIYHKRLIDNFRSFKKEYVKIAIRNWIIGLGAMMISNIIISSLAGGIASNEEANRVLLSEYPVSSFISMIFLGPLIEEIVFRASFKKAFPNWYSFAIVTSLLFGFAHISSFLSTNNYWELLYLIPYSALGFFFAKAFFETDNIYTSYFAHMLHNAMCVILLLIIW